MAVVKAVVTLVSPVVRAAPMPPVAPAAERSSHCGDDASRDDHVLERHHAVLVRAQAVQEVGALDVKLQHE